MDIKKIAPIFMAIIFLSSILVVFGTSSLKGKKATIIVDLGLGKVYQNEISIDKDTTALTLLSSYTKSVELENGKLKCVLNYCNNVNYEWHVYKLKNGIESEINTKLEDVKVNEGDTFIYRYVLTEKNQTS